MKNIQKQTYLGCLAFMLALWIFTPQSNPVWIKHLIFFLTIIQQSLIFWLFRKQIARPSKKSNYFGLTEKLYTATIFAAIFIYTVGIWILAPATQPVWIKHLILGISCLIEIGTLLYFLFKKVDEKPDERFYSNLAKAACLTLFILFICLTLLTLITFFWPFTLTTGMVLIFFGIIILLFNIAFFHFEKRGG